MNTRVDEPQFYTREYVHRLQQQPTMRQYYKAAVINGLLASVTDSDQDAWAALGFSDDDKIKLCVRDACKIADALLAEDEQKRAEGGK